ncbi:hypothetical protein [Rhodospirillum sp. A1_3_36]|uniref:hypothetical protein n=1 Tax=Rhodospirillum sp. A1_3_36 TaxID=3391666 RepID=UPI0039A67286
MRYSSGAGGLEWLKETSEDLRVTPLDASTRTPLAEWSGQTYRDAADLIRAKAEGRSPRPSAKLVPGVKD